MKRKIILAGVLVAALCGTLASVLPSCGEECLAEGENCTQAYKEREYGTTSIQCCEGSCTEGSGNGVLICH